MPQVRQRRNLSERVAEPIKECVVDHALPLVAIVSLLELYCKFRKGVHIFAWPPAIESRQHVMDYLRKGDAAQATDEGRA